jgi:hypothetical protein
VEVRPATALLALNQTGLQEHLQVVADRRLAESKRFGEVTDAGLMAGLGLIRLSRRSRAGSAITFNADASWFASSVSSGACRSRHIATKTATAVASRAATSLRIPAPTGPFQVGTRVANEVIR